MQVYEFFRVMVLSIHSFMWKFCATEAFMWLGISLTILVGCLVIGGQFYVGGADDA